MVVELGSPRRSPGVGLFSGRTETRVGSGRVPLAVTYSTALCREGRGLYRRTNRKNLSVPNGPRFDIRTPAELGCKWPGRRRYLSAFQSDQGARKTDPKIRRCDSADTHPALRPGNRLPKYRSSAGRLFQLSQRSRCGAENEEQEPRPSDIERGSVTFRRSKQQAERALQKAGSKALACGAGHDRARRILGQPFDAYLRHPHLNEAALELRGVAACPAFWATCRTQPAPSPHSIPFSSSRLNASDCQTLWNSAGILPSGSMLGSTGEGLPSRPTWQWPRPT